jgi:hypothetical protein
MYFLPRSCVFDKDISLVSYTEGEQAKYACECGDYFNELNGVVLLQQSIQLLYYLC